MNALYVNIDINSTMPPFLNEAVRAGTVCPQALYPYVDNYRGTHVTDVLFDIFCQYSATDTVCWDTYADKYLQTEENGIAVDYTSLYEGIYRLNREYGIDPYRVLIDRCRADGMRAWISVRTNDYHECVH